MARTVPSKGDTKAVDELLQAFDTQFFKAFSEPVRLEIVRFLLKNGRSDVAAIAETFPQDRSVISRHLKTLLDAGIVTAEKETRHMMYQLDGKAVLANLELLVARIKDCLAVCCP